MTQTPSNPFAFQGGLNLTSAALGTPPGNLAAANNYEPLAEGYGRIPGYERFDGKALPSKTMFSTLAFDQGAVPISNGMTITGATSGATALVLAEPYGVTGSWTPGTAAGTLILRPISGAFVDNEPIRVAGVPYALSNGVMVQDSAPTEVLRRTWTLLAREYQRALIAKVPGIGPVRGVALLKGTLYAWRDIDATYAGMYKAGANGWEPAPPSWSVPFNAGTIEPSIGDVVTRGVANAVIRRVILQSGTWSGGDAAGYFALAGRTTAFTPGDLKNASAVTIAHITAGDQQVFFSAGGRYDVIGHNFYGATNRYSLYGAYGTGKGFEFDGTVVTTISTGMPVDKPSRVAEIAQHLILTFPGGSVQFSEQGEPLEWNAVLGAGEIGLGDDVTDMIQSAETAVAIFAKGKVATLTGTGADDFVLSEISEEAGADAYTAQRIGTAIYLDNRGLRTLTSTAAFGNFKTGTLTELVAPLLLKKRKNGIIPVLSLTAKSKAQYRLYWNDGTGITVYVGGKNAETIPFDLGDMRPFCGCTGEMNDGTEGIFIGSEDGFVYRMDSGPSFDGAAITAFAMLPYNSLGGALQNKRYHGVHLEMIGGPNTKLVIGAQYDYGDGSQPMDTGRLFDVQGGGGAWDASDWNDFYWSSAFEGVATAPIDGFGRNISIVLAAQSDVLEEPHILQAYIIYYSLRGLKRIG